MGRRTTAVGVLVALPVVVLGGCADRGGDTGRPDHRGEEAARTLRGQRDDVRDLLAGLGRGLVAAGPGVRAELRGTYAGCESDALGQGYRTWTYAGGGRITGGVTLAHAERVLVELGADEVRRTRDEVRGTREQVAVAVTPHRGALVVSARARPCTAVPAAQQEVWLGREDASRIPTARHP